MTLLFKANSVGSQDGPPDTITSVPSGTGVIDLSDGGAGYGFATAFTNDPAINGQTYTPQDAAVVVTFSVPSLVVVFGSDQHSVVGGAYRSIVLIDTDPDGSSAFQNQSYFQPGVWSADGTRVTFPAFSGAVSSYYNLPNGDSIKPELSDALYFGTNGASFVPVNTTSPGTVTVNTAGGAPHQVILLGFEVPS